MRRVNAPPCIRREGELRLRFVAATSIVEVAYIEVHRDRTIDFGVLDARSLHRRFTRLPRIWFPAVNVETFVLTAAGP